MTRSLDSLPRVEITSPAELRGWLREHHLTSEGIWLVTYKKGASRPRVPWSEVVDELLCFGWIDSLPRALDGERTMLLCTPRRPTSKWSKVNKDRVAALERDGRMAPRGAELVALARASGTWSALDEADALLVPSDLAGALASRPGAADTFAGFPPSTRRGILEWIAQAKRAATRARRIEETARLAAEGKRAQQWIRRVRGVPGP